MSPEEQEKCRQDYITCTKCKGTLRRKRQNALGPDFTDCRDYLHTVCVKCEDCGTPYKRRREFVPGGLMRADDFNALIDQFGWPVPAFALPPFEPPSLEEMQERNSK